MFGIPVNYLVIRMRVEEFVALMAAKGFDTFDVKGFGSWTNGDHTATHARYVAEYGFGPANGTGHDEEWVWSAVAVGPYSAEEQAQMTTSCEPHVRAKGEVIIGSSPTEPPIRFLANEPLPCFVDSFLAVACANSGSNLASGYAPWGAVNEERVEITASAVAAGNTIIAVVSWNQTHAHVEQVYDQRGNVWTLDAEHETTGSSQDDTVQIWRCNVTTPIQAGDYIRLGFNVGASLLATVESSGRCIGAYAYAGILSVATVGTGAGGFSSTPSINTPAGDVVVAGLSVSNDTAAAGLTADPDWSAMVPATDTVGGVADDASMVFAQQLTSASVTTWTPTLGTTRDWAAIAVGYTRS